MKYTIELSLNVLTEGHLTRGRSIIKIISLHYAKEFAFVDCKDPFPSKLTFSSGMCLWKRNSITLFTQPDRQLGNRICSLLNCAVLCCACREGMTARRGGKTYFLHRRPCRLQNRRMKWFSGWRTVTPQLIMRILRS